MPNSPAQTTKGQMQQAQIAAQRQQMEAQEAEMAQIQEQEANEMVQMQAQEQALTLAALKQQQKQAMEDDPKNRNVRAVLGKASRQCWLNSIETLGLTFIGVIFQFFARYLYNSPKAPRFGYFLDAMAGQKMSPPKEPSKGAEYGEIMILIIILFMIFFAFLCMFTLLVILINPYHLAWEVLKGVFYDALSGLWNTLWGTPTK